jgi:hypothetical protein
MPLQIQNAFKYLKDLNVISRISNRQKWSMNCTQNEILKKIWRANPIIFASMNEIPFFTTSK